LFAWGGGLCVLDFSLVPSWQLLVTQEAEGGQRLGAGANQTTRGFPKKDARQSSATVQLLPVATDDFYRQGN
jgi:hypothetical protein